MNQTQATPPKPYTLTVERVVKAPRERVFNAFLNPDALCKWLPPGGFTGRMYAMDARVGGRFRMSFSNLNGTETIFFGGEFLEIKPHERIRYTDEFETDNPLLKGLITVTVNFRDVPGGTEVHVVQEGVPGIIPIEGSTAGWNMSLDNLQRLVEL
jgi:uncharacterized protein YndB with AHSA1/START domain